MTARSDLRGGVCWMLFGLAILVASWRMDRFESMGATLYTAPGFVPATFGIVLMLLGAVLAWRGWSARPQASAVDEPKRLLNRRIVLMLVLSLGYAAGLVGRVPFWFATSVFVAVFTAAYAEGVPIARRVITALISGGATTLAILIVFERLFLVRLP